jgi:hypothetical protein
MENTTILETALLGLISLGATTTVVALLMLV